MAVPVPGAELRAVVDELRAMQPSPLLGTSSNAVRLWAWAEDVAADLHSRLPDLKIVVGYLRYPERLPERPLDFDAHYAQIPSLDPTRARVALDGPLAVSCGHDGHHRLNVTNLSDAPMVAWTNGSITAHVIDPSTGSVVGISTMAQVALGVAYRAEPGDSVAIPMIVGTASVNPELGYAVPAGTWDLRPTISLVSDEPGPPSEHLTPPLRFEIV